MLLHNLRYTKLRLAALLYCFQRWFDSVQFSHVGRADPTSMGSEGQGWTKRLMQIQRTDFGFLRVCGRVGDFH